MDVSKYVMHNILCICDTFPDIWQFFHFLPLQALPGRQFSSSPWQAVGKTFGKTFFQPWQWGSLLQHEHQEHEAWQHCQREIQRIHATAQDWIQQVSSSLALIDADPLSNRWVASGLQHWALQAAVAGSLSRQQQQEATLIFSCCSSQQWDPEQPAGPEGREEGGGQGCKRRFWLNNNGNAMHLSGDEWIQLSMNRSIASRLAWGLTLLCYNIVIHI